LGFVYHQGRGGASWFMLGTWDFSRWIKLSLFPFTWVQSLLTQSGYGIPTPCLYSFWTHRACYGCGMMRSLNALWQGDGVASWHAHKLGGVVWLLLAVLFIQQWIHLRSVGPWRFGPHPRI